MSVRVAHLSSIRTGFFAVVDKPLFYYVVALLALGIVMVASSSLAIADKHVGYAFHYFQNQVIYIAISLCVATFLFFVPPQKIFGHGGYLIILSFLLLLLVLLPEIGTLVNGSRRWLDLGIVTIQPSEFVKLFLVIYISDYIARHREHIRADAWGLLKPMAVVALIGVLLILEPDYGTMVVIVVMTLGMLWLTPVRIRHFLLLACTCAAVLSIIAVAEPYRLKRLLTFTDPWQDQFDSGYQLTQSLIAIGSGGWFGVGLGNSMQKLFYLPEAHTDFIFAVFAEEFGLVGVCVLLLMFGLLVRRCFYIGDKALREDFVASAYFAYGIGIWIAVQSMVNMAVAMGIVPTKGITLPFISAGGSSLLALLAAIGILMRIHYEVQTRVFVFKPDTRRKGVHGGR